MRDKNSKKAPKKLHIKKEDNVVVISGSNKGSKGRVIKVLPKENKAIVEGVNMAKKHQKPTQQNQSGQIVEIERPIHLSNLMLIDPKTGEACRIGRKLDDNGKLVRYSKKTNEIIK